MNTHAPNAGFIDNHDAYADFSRNTTEKIATAKKIAEYIPDRSAQAALNIVDLGMGDAISSVELLGRIAANDAHRVNLLAKETDADLIRLAVPQMAVRLALYSKTNIIIPNGFNTRILSGDLGERVKIVVESTNPTEMEDELRETLEPLLVEHWEQAKAYNPGGPREFKDNTALDIRHAVRADDQPEIFEQGFDIAMALQAANISADAAKRARLTMTPALKALKPGGQYFATQPGEPSSLYETFRTAGIPVGTFAASLTDVYEAARSQLGEQASAFTQTAHEEFDFEIVRQGASNEAYLHRVFGAIAYHGQIQGYGGTPLQDQVAVLLAQPVGEEVVTLTDQLIVIERDI